MTRPIDHIGHGDREIDLQHLSILAHERHLRFIYGLRWAGLGLSTITISLGAIMIFLGLKGDFNWAVEAPNTLGAKLTNASPGIVFATIGMFIGLKVAGQSPVEFTIEPDRGSYLGPPREVVRRKSAARKRRI